MQVFEYSGGFILEQMDTQGGTVSGEWVNQDLTADDADNADQSRSAESYSDPF